MDHGPEHANMKLESKVVAQEDEQERALTSRTDNKRANSSNAEVAKTGEPAHAKTNQGELED